MIEINKGDLRCTLSKKDLKYIVKNDLLEHFIDLLLSISAGSEIAFLEDGDLDEDLTLGDILRSIQEENDDDKEE